MFKPEVQKNFEEKQKSRELLSPTVVGQYTKIIANFKKLLVDKIEPFGNSFSGFEINKPNKEIEKILYSLKLYHYSPNSDEKMRKVARHYYSRLVAR